MILKVNHEKSCSLPDAAFFSPVGFTVSIVWVERVELIILPVCRIGADII